MGTKTEPGAFDAYAAAKDDEPIFTLLARDDAAPGTVRSWADRREQALHEFDGAMTGPEFFAELEQIAEARRVADQMADYKWHLRHRDDV